MSTAADRYRKLTAQMDQRIAAVSPDQWSSPTPCEGWTVRDVVGHLVDSSKLFLGFIGRSLPDGAPTVADDPLGAFRAATGAVQEALDDPATADQEYEGFSGPTKFADGVDNFLSADLVVHQWDIARATGQDETLDLDEVRSLDSRLRPLGDMLRSPGAFGPEIEPAPDADEQTRLLNFLGRRV
jgi:uncharacterized protein (TIGR03086 family)